MILNGWISPEGEILQCGFCGHIIVAEKIVNSLPDKWDRLEKADMKDCQVLFDLGYVRFFQNISHMNFHIYIKETRLSLSIH